MGALLPGALDELEFLPVREHVLVPNAAPVDKRLRARIDREHGPGQETGFGVAIWEGSNSERAGIKSFSGNWMPLQLAATTAGRNA